jgi:hypothetical protein
MTRLDTYAGQTTGVKTRPSFEASLMGPDEKQALIERLYENESLTDNLTDAEAKALLRWAEEQIQHDTADSIVTAAVRAANQSGVEGVQALLAQANAFLVQALHAQAVSAARAAASSDTALESTASHTEPSSAQLAATGESGVLLTLSAQADAAAAPAPNPPEKKSRRSRKRKSK